MHTEILQRLYGRRNSRERRYADVFDENLLGGGSPALHAVEYDCVRTGFYGERDIVIGTRSADFDVNRLLPVSDFAQLVELDFQIVWARPVGMTAGGALVDALRQRAHLGHSPRDFLSEQHAAAARLSALSHHDFDRVRRTQIVGIHAVARWQHLVDQNARMFAFFRRHAAIARGGRGAHGGGATPQCFLGWR